MASAWGRAWALSFGSAWGRIADAIAATPGYSARLALVKFQAGTDAPRRAAKVPALLRAWDDQDRAADTEAAQYKAASAGPVQTASNDGKRVARSTRTRTATDTNPNRSAT